MSREIDAFVEGNRCVCRWMWEGVIWVGAAVK